MSIERDPNLNIVVPDDMWDAIVDSVLRGFYEEIREKLLNGESVLLPGIGTLEPHHRRVKNPVGKNYSMKIWLKHDSKFKDALMSSFAKNREKFEKYV